MLISRIIATACPLPRDEIDTDALIPVSENSRLSRTGFGDALFAAWRYLDIPARTPNPDFVLNRSPFNRAEILIAGRNMGCGSSRESAVWALRDYGFKAILATSFNEIFMQNCVANGLWPLTLQWDAISNLAEAVLAQPHMPLVISLDDRTIAPKPAGEGAEEYGSYSFTLDAYYARLLGEGLTEDGLLERYRPAIVKRVDMLESE